MSATPVKEQDLAQISNFLQSNWTKVINLDPNTATNQSNSQQTTATKQPVTNKRSKSTSSDSSDDDEETNKKQINSSFKGQPIKPNLSVTKQNAISQQQQRQIKTTVSTSSDDSSSDDAKKKAAKKVPTPLVNKTPIGQAQTKPQQSSLAKKPKSSSDDSSSDEDEKKKKQSPQKVIPATSAASKTVLPTKQLKKESDDSSSDDSDDEAAKNKNKSLNKSVAPARQQQTKPAVIAKKSVSSSSSDDSSSDDKNKNVQPTTAKSTATAPVQRKQIPTRSSINIFSDSALQARLLQRGILNASNINGMVRMFPITHDSKLRIVGNLESDVGNDHSDVQEEVIAESYDEREEHNAKHDESVDSGIALEECINCPNRSNPYHECVDYCKKRYGFKRYTPDPETDRRRRKMLKRYPLSENWREVPDASTDRCYYWNTETDEVSWLPPDHPRSFITVSAIKIKRKECETKSLESSRSKKKMTVEDAFGDETDSEEEEMNSALKLKRKVAGKLLNYDRDPMDPSSYSDIPTGTWAAGLVVKGKAKTGVDETAAGPLFQMRPYPSPGAVLKLNAESVKPTKKKKLVNN
ncbi:unnamed protein product [Didymodactylos carnosus]|uniref:WW domain-containing protein n=1 Tax=Didymodactylos carnosus TaxID=1234261 RepID=A0A8S2E8G1_9BILA|nr:unnamed protein product [Didymodactylos carnosus]CAF3932716.1 unnamed protein product [Didymodactylos carnosus]